MIILYLCSMVGIYKITNTVNGKFYIGSSKDIESRLNGHFVALENNIHKNKHLQSSYNKYGKDKFITEVLEECDISALVDREQYYLDNGNWNIMYNKTKQAYGGGSDAMTKELVLIDLDGNFVDRFYSGRDLSRFLKCKGNLNYSCINTCTIFNKIYRVVSLEFFEKHKDIIYSWDNYEETYKDKYVKYY